MSIFSSIKKSPRLFITWLAVGGIAGIVWFAVAEREYTSTMSITPSEYSNSEVGNLANKLGGLKKIFTGAGDASQSALPLDVLKSVMESQRVAEILVNNPLVRETILASYLESVQNPSLKTRLVRFIKGWVTVKPISEETQLVMKWVKTKVNVKDGDYPSVFVIEASYKDPYKTKALLEEVFRASDDIVRKRFLKSINLQIDYLNQRVKEITLQDTRQPIFDMITALERRRVAFSTDLPVSAMILEAATLPQAPSNPSFIKTMMKAMMGFAVLAFIHIYLKEKRKKSEQ